MARYHRLNIYEACVRYFSLIAFNILYTSKHLPSTSAKLRNFTKHAKIQVKQNDESIANCKAYVTWEEQLQNRNKVDATKELD